MTTGSRTEGIRGIGTDGFIRTVKNLTVTGDLVVHGVQKSTVGTGSAFWETADANANYWAFDLPSGGSITVPVVGFGIGLTDVDLGLFDGITQTTLAVLDANRDSFIALDFSADDAARLRSNTAVTITATSITMNPTTTLSVGSDGSGKDVIFYSDTSGDNLTWDSGDEVLQITGTDSQTSLDVLDGDVRIVDKLYFFDRGGEYMSSDGSTLTVTGTVVFPGNITVQGTTTTIDSTVVVIADPLFHLGNDNNADAVDLGIFGEYTDSGKKFAGLFRDASDSDKWKLFSRSGNSDEEPSTTVNTTSGFALGDLAVNELDGTLTTAAQTNITSVGALDGGSITSNFGTIDTGASTITTTGLISGGSLDIDNVLINGTTIGHTDDTDLLTVANGILTLAGQLILDGNRSLTPGDGGAIHLDTHTVTDSNTGGSGTATKYTHVNIEAPTLAATNSSVTTTDAATLYINAAATAGTNQTITNNYALWVDAGATRLDGALTVDGDLTFTGAQKIDTTAGDLTIDAAGNIIIDGNFGHVGIGTSSPDLGTGRHLTIAGDGNEKSKLALVNLTPSNGAAIGNVGFFVGTTDMGGMAYTLDSGVTTAGHLQFYSALSDTPVLVMTMESSGDVGIGIAAPTEELHVYKTTNGQVAAWIQNANTGTSAYSEVIVGQAATNALKLGMAHNYTGATEWNNCWIFADNKDLALKSDQVIDFYTGGTGTSDKRMSISNDGTVITFSQATELTTTTGNITLDPVAGAYISIGDGGNEGGRLDCAGLRLNGGSFVKATGGTPIGIQVAEAALTTGSLGSMVAPYQNTSAGAFVDGTGGNLNGSFGFNRDSDDGTTTLEARVNGSWVSVALSGYEIQGNTSGGITGWWHENQIIGDERVNETVCVVCGEQMVPEDTVSMYANYKRSTESGENLHAIFGHAHLERDVVIQGLLDRIEKLEAAIA